MGENPHLFFCINMMKTGTKLQVHEGCKKKLAKLKMKNYRKHYVVFSNQRLSEPARLGLALMQIKPISVLKRAFQLFRVQGLPSKISPCLEFQIVQQAVMRISLKMGLPKVALASINISSGGKLKSQCMPMWFQQERLKGQSKKRCMQVSSTLLLQMAQL